MDVHCSYFGNGEFYGLNILGDVSKDWEYYSDRYIDYVVDCLNGNFFSIAAECFPIMSTPESDPLELNKQVVASVKERYKSRSIADDLASYWEEVLPETLKRYEAVKSDLGMLDIEFYRAAVDTIYINDKFPELTLRQKYYAFRSSMFPKKLGTDKYAASVVLDMISQNLKPDSSTGVLENADFDEEVRTLEVENKFDEVCKLILKKRTSYNICVGQIYTFQSFRDTFIFLFHEMLKDEYIIRQCKHCGRYFAPRRKGETLCDMPSPECPAKDCQEYVKYQKYLDKTHNEAARLHKQIYNQKANKVRRTGNSMLKVDLNKFKDESEQWREKVRCGTKEEAEYIEWLRWVKSGENLFTTTD